MKIGMTLGTARELREMLVSMEAAGAHELLLIPTTIDPDEVDRVAEVVGEKSVQALGTA